MPGRQVRAHLRAGLINVHAKVKSTVPKTSHEDLKSWSMIEVAFVVDSEEDPDQEKIPGA